MKKINFTVILLIFATTFAFASKDKDKKDDNEGYKFKDVKVIDHTSVKNQYRSGTCWSFSTISFIEAELIRLGKGEFDLADMWPVRCSYIDKAHKYVRWHGNLNFGGGGAFHDVFNTIHKYGIMPESVYNGLHYGQENHVHGELDALLKGYVDNVVENKNRKLSTAWKAGYQALIDTYLGETPKNFEYKGKIYKTPLDFAAELDIKEENYIEIGSFTHHPYYEKFILEVPDNWDMGEIYNVKINEMTDIIDYALNNGFTVAWGADVSEKGFSWSNGVAVIPDHDKADMTDSERSKWSKLTEKEKKALLYNFDKPGKEKEITQEMRQEAFDNYETTDDHGMHIVGIAKDQNGKEYYKVKNSWSDKGHVYDGYFYVSKAFVKYKTIDFVIHKDALSKEMAKKLNIN